MSNDIIFLKNLKQVLITGVFVHKIFQKKKSITDEPPKKEIFNQPTNRSCFYRFIRG